MTTREELQAKLETLDAAALDAVAAFIVERECKLRVDAEYAAREATTNKQMALLRELASGLSEEESFAFEMDVKGLPVRSADAEANAREARLFATMLDSLSMEGRIDALLDAGQGRDEYVLLALRMVKTLVAPMSWEQERAFDIGLTARLWAEHDRLDKHELATFTIAVIQKIADSDETLREQLAERNVTHLKENP